MFCHTCGRPIDPTDRFCATCGATLTAPAEQDSRATGSLPGIASLGRRIFAAILDLLTIWAVICVIVAVVPPPVLEAGFARKWPEVLVPTGMCLLLLSYYVIFEACWGATGGKAIAGIQVRRIDFSACSLRESLVRNLLRVVDAIAAYLVGLVTAAVSHSRQRIGDLLAGTIVVRHAFPTALRVLAVLAWLAVSGAGFVACEAARR